MPLLKVQNFLKQLKLFQLYEIFEEVILHLFFCPLVNQNKQKRKKRIEKIYL